jgi:hypothetical protein
MAVIRSGASTDNLSIDATSKAARVTLYDSAGNKFESIYDPASGDYYLGVGMVQDIHASTSNSTTANINAGATWSGTSESTVGVSGIQVMHYVDRPRTMYIYQSGDGSNFDVTDSWDAPAGQGARTIQAVGSHFYIACKNNGGTATTVVRIYTALCPTVEALPRSLTAGGNLKITPQADWQNARRAIGLYVASSFRTLGDTNATQNIFSIENPAASTALIAVRGLNCMTDSTAVLTSVAPQLKSSRPTGLPTGGTVLSNVKYRTSFATANAICRGATASDGGGATAITATAGTTLWAQFVDRQHTNVGLIAHPNYNLLPDVGGDLRQIILLPGEALLVQAVGANAATTHIVVNCSWYEQQYL